MSLATLSNECSICLEKIWQDAKLLHCAHTFHRSCIDLWLSRRKSCPICRSRQGVTDLETDCDETGAEEEGEDEDDDQMSSDAEELEVELEVNDEEDELELYDEEDELVVYDMDDELEIYEDEEHLSLYIVQEILRTGSGAENHANDEHDDDDYEIFDDEDMHSLDTESFGSVNATEEGELDVGFEDDAID
uniref:RING-type domain-containing protein n=2 Tax=Anopheles atroparvus TaxID=41427 RepID=A0A182J438_ANOAO